MSDLTRRDDHPAIPPGPSRWGWAGRLAGFVAMSGGFAFLLWLGLGVLSASDGASSPELVWSVVLPELVAAVAATWWLARVVDRRPLRWLGMGAGPGRAAGELVLGTLVGLVTLGATILPFVLLGWASWSSIAGAGPGALTFADVSLLLLAAAFAEEFLFRGYPFRVLEERFGPAVALGVTSICFGLAHGANPGITPIALANLTLAGVLLGAAYMKTRSMWFVGGLHFGWNWLMAASGLSVSGIHIPMTGLDANVTGPQVWTGSGFGPEGGLIATLVTVLATIWLWPRAAFAAPAAGAGQGMTARSELGQR